MIGHRKGPIIFSLLALFSTIVEATYSIVAVDLDKGLIGAASATCILSSRFSLLEALYRSVVGKGVLVTQAVVQDDTSPAVVLARELIEDGTDPQQVLDRITDREVDGARTSGNFFLADLRQYGLVDFEGRGAGYTGASLEQYYSFFGFDPSVQENVVESDTSDGFIHAAQGNIVTDGTVPTVSAAFDDRENGCDLPQKLFNALVSVQNGGSERDFLGDVRCRDLGIAGSISFLHVEDKAGNVLLSIDVKYQPGVDPLETVRDLFSEWRQRNPCPSGAPTANPGDTPTELPSAEPDGIVPSEGPSKEPTASPMAPPTATPTEQTAMDLPSVDPTTETVPSPTATPTACPATEGPTSAPTAIIPVPAASPSASPSSAPMILPTASSGADPAAPSSSSSSVPTGPQTTSSSADPTASPAVSPTVSPTDYSSLTTSPEVSPTSSATPSGSSASVPAGHHVKQLLILLQLLLVRP